MAAHSQQLQLHPAMVDHSAPDLDGSHHSNPPPSSVLHGSSKSRRQGQQGPQQPEQIKPSTHGNQGSTVGRIQHGPAIATSSMNDPIQSSIPNPPRSDGSNKVDWGRSSPTNSKRQHLRSPWHLSKSRTQPAGFQIKATRRSSTERASDHQMRADAHTASASRFRSGEPSIPGSSGQQRPVTSSPHHQPPSVQPQIESRPSQHPPAGDGQHSPVRPTKTLHHPIHPEAGSSGAKPISKGSVRHGQRPTSISDSDAAGGSSRNLAQISTSVRSWRHQDIGHLANPNHNKDRWPTKATNSSVITSSKRNPFRPKFQVATREKPCFIETRQQAAFTGCSTQ
ncbi:hypothetical protein ACLOJK_028547, partial [Asimina triloba]